MLNTCIDVLIVSKYMLNVIMLVEQSSNILVAAPRQVENCFYCYENVKSTASLFSKSQWQFLCSPFRSDFLL